LADHPELLVVAGPNGAGKTTLARDFAATSNVAYLGADAIAETLAPHDPSSVRVEGGRRFIESVNEFLSRKESVIVETTLSGRTFRNILADATQRGFSVTIVYLFMKSADTCVARVAERVRKGGHDVPEIDVRRRFIRSLANFWTIYREMADKWVVVYNETSQLQDVAAGSRLDVIIRDSILFQDFLAIGGFSPDD
jgi:predicted ABC-type ATPase